MIIPTVLGKHISLETVNTFRAGTNCTAFKGPLKLVVRALVPQATGCR